MKAEISPAGVRRKTNGDYPTMPSQVLSINFARIDVSHLNSMKKLPRKERKALIPLAYLNFHSRLAIESTILLSAEHACHHMIAFLLRLLDTPFRKQSASALSLKIRMDTTNV